MTTLLIDLPDVNLVCRRHFVSIGKGIMADSEDELLDRASRGDRDALVQLFQHHGPRVRAALAGQIPRRFRSLLDEQDILQETYVDAFLGIGRFTPKGSAAFTSWLVKIAMNNVRDAIDGLEADRRRPPRGVKSNDESLLDLLNLVSTTGTTPSRHAARNEAKAALAQAIGQLPKTYRLVVQTDDLQGRPAEEVSATLERSQGAMFMIRKRAHRLLAELMGSASKYLSGSG